MKKLFMDNVVSKDDLKSLIDNNVSSNNKLFHHVFLTIVCSFIFMLILYKSPTSYLSVDINPSIMISTNLFNRVISVRGLNDDGKKILDNISIVNMNKVDAIKEIIFEVKKEGVLSNEDSLLLSLYGKGNAKLDKRIINIIGDEILVAYREYDKKHASEFNEYGVSYGKVKLVEEAMKENPDMEFNEYIYKPTTETTKRMSCFDYHHGRNNEHKGKSHGSDECCE